ncbi:penicillin-binding protein 2 [soil metagenome]
MHRPPSRWTFLTALALAWGTATPPQIAASGIPSTPQTRPDARVFTVTVPAPRGRILDRNGQVLANSEAVQHLALRFPTIDGAEDDAEQILRYAVLKLAEAKGITGLATPVALPDRRRLLGHYHHRRWLPLPLGPPLTPEDSEAVAAAGIGPNSPGLTVHTTYLRRYPKGMSAAHVVGYVRRERPLETGPIISGEPLFEHTTGVTGLEKSFDETLAGKPGQIRLVVDGDGSLLAMDTTTPAVPGHDVVTSIESRLQTLAESILARRAKRGAMVVVDAGTGDVLALASEPAYDPNAFVPAISEREFALLTDASDAPLFPRAYAGQYPPASAFKPVVALGVLASDKVDTATLFDTPVSLMIDGREFNNWYRDRPEGEMDVSQALARSSNTWFYQAGLAAGPAPILDMARELGFGAPTGIPLPHEAPGQLPGREDLVGSPQAVANLSIGQGTVLATPLQMAVATASIADGTRRFAPRLVLQIQDVRGAVLEAFPETVASLRPFGPGDGGAVREGMFRVINAPDGSAHDNAISPADLYGKTGTAQWGERDGLARYLAWFVGFLQAESPQIAFSAIYEGGYGEEVEGHLHGAPMIADLLRTALLRPDAFGLSQPAPRRAPTTVSHR